MKFSAQLASPATAHLCGQRQGFTLTEVMVGVAILATVLVSLFGLLSFNIGSTQFTRENIRATEIVGDKMECLRLYQWQQLTNRTFLASTFTNWTYDYTNVGTATTNGLGIQYVGSITLTSPPPQLAGTSYASNLALVTVSVSWTSCAKGLPHTRSISTLFGSLGMESIIQTH